jgi:hypothetical protein
MQNFNEPPAMVHRTERNLDDIAREIREYDTKATQHAKEGAAYYRLVGERLIEAKSKLPDHKWLAWLSENTQLTPRQAQRYMKLARECDVTSHMEQAWSVICGNGEKPEQQTIPGVDPNAESLKVCRPHQIDGHKLPVHGCKACAAMNEPVEQQPEQEIEELPPDREPGQDDGEIDQAHEQMAQKDIKRLLKAATDPLWRLATEIAAKFGKKIGKRYDDPDTDPAFRPVIRKLGDVRSDLDRLYQKWELEAKGPGGAA